MIKQFMSNLRWWWIVRVLRHSAMVNVNVQLGLDLVFVMSVFSSRKKIKIKISQGELEFYKNIKENDGDNKLIDQLTIDYWRLLIDEGKRFTKTKRVLILIKNVV